MTVDVLDFGCRLNIRDLGLIFFFLGGISGGMMSALLTHTIGAEDGGPGLPFFELEHPRRRYSFCALYYDAWASGHTAGCLFLHAILQRKCKRGCLSIFHPLSWELCLAPLACIQRHAPVLN